jgi:ribosomal protein S18 acetylase RimI-like enzyme
MLIRRAVSHDVPHVLPLVRRICDLHGSWDPQRFDFRDDVTERYRGWLVARSEDSKSVFLVAETSEGKIVGYAVGTVEPEIPIYWTPECGWIHDIWIDEEYRNEGAGRQMVMMCVEAFSDLNVKQVRLQTATANEMARKLFASCGFRACTVEMMWMKPE